LAWFGYLRQQGPGQDFLVHHQTAASRESFRGIALFRRHALPLDLFSPDGDASHQDFPTMTTPSFKPSLTLPITGSHQLKRFEIWAAENAPEVA
jgi:hypothetical protein